MSLRSIATTLYLGMSRLGPHLTASASAVCAAASIEGRACLSAQSNPYPTNSTEPSSLAIDVYPSGREQAAKANASAFSAPLACKAFAN